MDLENIVSVFCKLSGALTTERSGFIDIVTYAYYYLSNRLIKEDDEYTDEEIAELEYAAACVAFYSYNTVIYSRENRYLSDNGKYISNSENDLRIKSAELMMNLALKNVRHLLIDDDFLFVNV